MSNVAVVYRRALRRLGAEWHRRRRMFRGDRELYAGKEHNLPIEIFASKQLTRRWRKIRKRGRALGKLDARGRHELRIQTKKLRYAAEFFATLFTTKRAVKRRKQFLSA